MRQKHLLGRSLRGMRRNEAAALVKEKLVEARMAGNDSVAAELSQIKETVKFKRGRCRDCGEACRGERCRVHAPRLRANSRPTALLRADNTDKQRWYNRTIADLL